jgi:hypothetical protein
MKTVEYMGSTYEVQDWCNFIAADLNGNVYGYSQQPVWNEVAYEPEDWDICSVEKLYSFKLPEQPPLKRI